MRDGTFANELLDGRTGGRRSQELLDGSHRHRTRGKNEGGEERPSRRAEVVVRGRRRERGATSAGPQASSDVMSAAGKID